MPERRRVALITDANTHLGPDLARVLAEKGHDLVLGEAAPGLVEELRALGAEVEAVDGVADLANPASIKCLVEAGLTRFARIDCACVRTGAIRAGSFLDASLEDLHTLTRLNIDSVFHVLQTLLPPMIEVQYGQIVIVTSAAGSKPVPTAPLYSATRAAANMLVKNVALAVAHQGITINAIGTNFLDYPGFVAASGADDPAVRKKIENQIPVKRLGDPAEVAHFCATLLDGTSRFQTGQFFSLSGGWGE